MSADNARATGGNNVRNRLAVSDATNGTDRPKKAEEKIGPAINSSRFVDPRASERKFLLKVRLDFG